MSTVKPVWQGWAPPEPDTQVERLRARSIKRALQVDYQQREIDQLKSIIRELVAAAVELDDQLRSAFRVQGYGGYNPYSTAWQEVAKRAREAVK